MKNPLPPILKGKKASEAFMEYVEPFLNALLEGILSTKLRD